MQTPQTNQTIRQFTLKTKFLIFVKTGLLQWVPSTPLGDSRSFFYADFLLDFSRIFGALLIRGKPEIEKQQKTGTGTDRKSVV